MQLKESALHGIMLATMEAHYQDLLTIKKMAMNGQAFDGNYGAVAELEADIHSIITRICNEMDEGMLNIFHCDWQTWMIEHGYMPHPQPTVDKDA